jgi:hypothetical protein
MGTSSVLEPCSWVSRTLHYGAPSVLNVSPYIRTQTNGLYCHRLESNQYRCRFSLICVIWDGGVTIRHCVRTHLITLTAMAPTPPVTRAALCLWMRWLPMNSESRRALYFWTLEGSALRANRGRWISLIHLFFAALKESIHARRLQLFPPATDSNSCTTLWQYHVDR